MTVEDFVNSSIFKQVKLKNPPSLSDYEITTIRVLYDTISNPSYLLIKLFDINGMYVTESKIDKKIITKTVISDIINFNVEELLRYKVKDIVQLKQENKKFKEQLDEKLPKLNRKNKRKIIVRG